MTDEQRLAFCKDMTFSAKSMGILIREDSHDGQYKFSWYDPLGNIILEGALDPDRKTAYEVACHKLVEHLKI